MARAAAWRWAAFPWLALCSCGSGPAGAEALFERGSLTGGGPPSGGVATRGPEAGGPAQDSFTVLEAGAEAGRGMSPGAPDDDGAASAVVPCDLTGTWATYVEVDVSWDATLAL